MSRESWAEFGWSAISFLGTVALLSLVMHILGDWAPVAIATYAVTRLILG